MSELQIMTCDAGAVRGGGIDHCCCVVEVGLCNCELGLEGTRTPNCELEEILLHWVERRVVSCVFA